MSGEQFCGIKFFLVEPQFFFKSHIPLNFGNLYLNFCMWWESQNLRTWEVGLRGISPREFQRTYMADWERICGRFHISAANIYLSMCQPSHYLNILSFMFLHIYFYRICTVLEERISRQVWILEVEVLSVFKAYSLLGSFAFSPPRVDFSDHTI